MQRIHPDKEAFGRGIDHEKLRDGHEVRMRWTSVGSRRYVFRAVVRVQHRRQVLTGLLEWEVRQSRHC